MSPDVRREMPRIEQLKHLDDVRITCVRAALDGYGFEWVGEAEIREMLDQLENGRDVTEVARRWHVISDLGTTAWLTESAALVEATNIRAHRTHVEVRVTVECKVTEIP